ncbi:hypothetical protein HGRIS_009361 [Hohenbuehelia grisea]|uniref:Peroxisome membrane anchor protein Pex14p N-terminal domain-containing protein n=1 Tax=Hohenbuehelia grisea TaxID=104357 RepID=A0ABR3J116_9AGAR
MADEGKDPQAPVESAHTEPASASEPTPSPSQTTPSDGPPPPTATNADFPSPPQHQPMQGGESRDELLSRAWTFLLSPQIRYQDVPAKRRFLAEKGLTDAEIDGLLRELPPPIPMVPPRTYPQPPPSHLPTLFIGILRIFSWIIGGSATVLLFYYRFLLPHITQSAIARQSLKSHHLSLFRKFTTDLAALKESQAESFAVLPRPEPYKEPSGFSECGSIDAVLKLEAAPEDIPPLTLLRCGISDFQRMKPDEKPTTEELFQIMEAKIPWLTTPEAVEVENALWDTLTTCPFFEQQVKDSAAQPNPIESPAPPPRQVQWTYNAPTPPERSPLVASLSSLSDAMPAKKAVVTKQELEQSPLQRTLQTLSDFTGYISTQVYMPYRPPGVGGMLGPAEDEMRREIRALKGLVLNRRSFMPTIPKAST